MNKNNAIIIFLIAFFLIGVVFAFSWTDWMDAKAKQYCHSHRMATHIVIVHEFHKKRFCVDQFNRVYPIPNSLLF